MTLSRCLHLPKLDQMVSCEYRDVPGPIQIPGCIPVHGKDLPDPLQDRSNDAYKRVLHNVKRYFMADGIVVNSFKERTKNRGLVVLNWAPQAQILSHSSSGGFLTHCGWNSILETIVLGVPIIAWPLYAEQKMNALMLTEGLKVAMRAKLNESGIVDHSEIVRVVNSLSKGDEGKAIRVRIKELKEAALSALSKDGCSTKTLDQLVSKLKSKI
ncbi:putative hydroquinone glucosyltransferase [Helianthus annuus]|nr:putative hydroquinone glucosyltransferase [Helianthus annuus]